MFSEPALRRSCGLSILAPPSSGLRGANSPLAFCSQVLNLSSWKRLAGQRQGLPAAAKCQGRRLAPGLPTSLPAQPNALTPPSLQLAARPAGPFPRSLCTGNPPHSLVDLPLPVHIQPARPSEPVLKSHLPQEAFLTTPASSPPGWHIMYAIHRTKPRVTAPVVTAEWRALP